MNRHRPDTRAGRMLAMILGMALIQAAFTGAATAGQSLQRPEAGQKLATYQLQVDGDLYIDTEGGVADYRLNNARDLTPEIAAMVDKEVRSWRFEPILVAGVPVTAKTRLNMQLTAEPVAGGYRLQVSSIGFGNPARQASSLVPPKYPKSAQRARVEADVILVLTLDADGKVTDTRVEQTRLSGKGPQRVMTQWADMFEQSAIAAARTWHFTVTEEVDGKLVRKSRVRVPFIYRVSGREGWRAMVPVQRPGQDTPPSPSSVQLTQASGDLDNGQPQALDSRFKLKDQVVGKVL